MVQIPKPRVSRLDSANLPCIEAFLSAKEVEGRK